MSSGSKMASYILIGVSALVFLYGLFKLTDGGSVGPLGIGIVGAGLGYILLRREGEDSGE